ALATVSFLVGVVFILLLSFPVYLLTRSALAPVRRRIEQQKQFITDASHELKTPLAIISADADVLEMCEGENEWVSSIKSQTARMDTLVRNLVSLSKLDETANEGEHVTFNLSEAVLDTALNFEPLAKSRNLQFTLDVAPGLTIKGSEGEIRQLVSLLCDNALKYTNDGGEIRLSLYKNGKTLCLDAYNTCESIEKDKLPHLFDRFYRADNSRARETGGYGIGLSIAKAIVERHKGKISAASADGRSILFRIQL
ncbi:MAG: GHKL domain-containing protein, partial [Pyramidobacter sp.]|nr:GHKL domain-containing protein [Pyramidobacter sp.]